jgi:hypothetical protein
VSKIIKETCDVIWDCLKETVLSVPSKEKWEDIAAGFEERWNFPHCLGAIDGKHIVIEVIKIN